MRSLDLAALFRLAQVLQPHVSVAVAADFHAGMAHFSELLDRHIHFFGKSAFVIRDGLAKELTCDFAAYGWRQAMLQETLDEYDIRRIEATFNCVPFSQLGIIRDVMVTAELGHNAQRARFESIEVVTHRQYKVHLVNIKHSPLIDRHRRRKERGLPAPCGQPRKHGPMMIYQPIVERQETGPRRQGLFTACGRNNISRRADLIIRCDVIELCIEFVNLPCLDADERR